MQHRPAQTTLNTNDGVRLYLHLAHDEQATIDGLEAMRRARVDTAQKARSARGTTKALAEADLLWEGIWSLTCSLRRHVEELRNRGGLLHFGRVQVTRDRAGEYIVAGPTAAPSRSLA